MAVRARIETAEAVLKAKSGAIGRMLPSEIKTISRGIELAEIPPDDRTPEQAGELAAIEQKCGCDFAEALRFLESVGL